MGLTKDDRDAVMKMYNEFRNAHGVTNDATAATLTLAAVLHGKNVLVHNTVSVGGEPSGGLHHGSKF